MRAAAGALLLTAGLLAGCTDDVAQRNESVNLTALRAPTAPPSYFLGSKFEGLPLTDQAGTVATPDFIYGDCAPTGDSGCSPPIEIQHWRLSQRPPSKFAPDIRCRRVRLGRVPAAIFESTGGIEVYIGDRTVVVFANDERQMRRAAAALRPVKGGKLPQPPTWVVRQLAARCR